MVFLMKYMRQWYTCFLIFPRQKSHFLVSHFSFLIKYMGQNCLFCVTNFTFSSYVLSQNYIYFRHIFVHNIFCLKITFIFGPSFSSNRGDGGVICFCSAVQSNNFISGDLPRKRRHKEFK